MGDGPGYGDRTERNAATTVLLPAKNLGARGRIGQAEILPEQINEGHLLDLVALIDQRGFAEYRLHVRLLILDRDKEIRCEVVAHGAVEQPAGQLVAGDAGMADEALQVHH